METYKKTNNGPYNWPHNTHKSNDSTKCGGQCRSSSKESSSCSVSGSRRVAHIKHLVMFVLVTIINLQIETLMYGAAVLSSNDEVKGRNNQKVM